MPTRRFHGTVHGAGHRAALRPVWAGLLAAGALLPGCREEAPRPDADPPAAEPVWSERADRVVALTPLAERFVTAMGAADRLVVPAPLDPPGTAPDPGAIAAAAPDLVLAGAGAPLRELGDRLPTARIVVFEPHDLEEVLAAAREVGSLVVGAAAASRFETRLARPLALAAGRFRDRPRLRVVAVRRLAPLEIAGGHSFETDLIQLAGARSVTHPGEAPSLQVGPEAWRELAPDVVLLVADAADAAARAGGPEPLRAALPGLPSGIPLVAFRFERDFWLEDPVEPVARLAARLHGDGAAGEAGAPDPGADPRPR